MKNVRISNKFKVNGDDRWKEPLSVKGEMIYRLSSFQKVSKMENNYFCYLLTCV